MDRKPLSQQIEAMDESIQRGCNEVSATLFGVVSLFR
jgi:hypothetical protein